MSSPPERSERTANEPTEHLTFAQAGDRLNISRDAVRMRVNRGTLASIQTNGRTFILWPQPEQPNEQRTERTPFTVRAGVQGDERLVAALGERIASLEQHLAERTEEIRRRDVIIANLVDQTRALPAGEGADQDAIRAPVSDVQPAGASDSLLARVRRLVGRRG